MSRALPSFDLVVATAGRTAELDRLLRSLERQSHGELRVLVVDQNGDDRLAPVLGAHPRLRTERVRSAPGLSRARNAALPLLSADVVAFPDDDCVYPPDLLERVAARLAATPGLDGLTGRTLDPGGASTGAWRSDPARLTRDNLWNRASSATVFLRRELVARVGPFDERLGLGSGEPWASGEEIDYLVRALAAGARVEYDPALAVEHEARPYTAALAARDGASVGYVLRKHRYGPRTLGRMLVRPAGGVLLALARLDRGRARIHAATLRGRLRGYRAARRSKSSR